MAKKINFRDLFNFDDESILRRLQDTLRNITGEVDKFGKKFQESGERVRQSARNQLESTEKLSAGNRNSREEIDKAARSADRLGKEYQELTNAQKATQDFNLKLKKSVEELTITYQRELQVLKLINKNTNPKRFEQQKQKVAQLQAQIRAFNKVLGDNTKKYQQANNLYEFTNQKLNRQRQLLKEQVVGWDRHGNAIFRNNTKAKQLLQSISQLDGRLRRFDRTVGQSFRNVGNYSSAFQGLRGSMMGVGRNFAFIVLGIAGLTQAINMGVTAFTDFEFKLSQVRGLSGATAEEFEKLEENATMLGRTTARTAADIADLQLRLTKLGFSPDEILQQTKAITELSIAFDEDLGKSAQVVASTLRAFNLEATETGRIADALSKSFARSALDLERWRTAVGYVGPQAATLGVSVETVAALLGRLADAGLNASTAATALRSIFAKLSDPTSKLNKLIGQQIKGDEQLLGVLKTLAEEGYAELAEATQLVDLRAQASFLTIAKGAEQTRNFSDEIKNSAGFLDEFSESIEETSKVGIKELLSALEGLFIALLKLTGKPILALIGLFRDILNLVSDFANEIEKDIVPILEKFFGTTEKGSDSIDDMVGSIKGEVAVMNEIFDRLQDVNTTTEERRGLIDDINKRYGPYLDNLLTEKTDIEDIAKIQQVLNQQLALGIALREEQIELEAAAQMKVNNIKSANEEIFKLMKEQQEYARLIAQQEDKRQRALEMGIIGEVQRLDNQITQNKAQKEALEQQIEFHRDAIDLMVNSTALQDQIRSKYDQILEALGLTRDMFKGWNKQQRESVELLGSAGEEAEELKVKMSDIEKEQRDILKLQKEWLDKDFAETLLPVEEAFTEGRISFRQYQRDIAAEEKAWNERRLRARIDLLRQFIETNKEYGYEYLEFQRMLAEAELDLEQQKNQEKLDYHKKLQDQIKRFQREAFNTFGNLLTEMVQIHGNKAMGLLQQSLGQLKEWYDNELEMAGDNERKKAAIRKEFEKEERDLKRRMAELDRQQAITEARINTFVAATRVLAQYGLPLGPAFAALIIAAGEAHVKNIKSTPIAAYEKGTEHTKKGPAWVAEKGPELMIEKTGDTVLFEQGPSLVDLPEGAKILNAMQTKALLNRASEYKDSISAAYGDIINVTHRNDQRQIIQLADLLTSQDDKVVKAIKKIPVYKTVFNDKGVSNYVERSNGTVKRLNKRNSL